ncbi:DUF1772 domain-containing protein [Mesorhizobium sp. IMUNJ 23232]|uniref:DUF1772 domain-containing protein n=1 Tax=Mesorhizobium sp. IMUNJ 23232 TaxID=3376064 RepID=UPI00379FDF54
MSERVFQTLTILAAVGSGVMGGLFFAYSTSVMGALGRVAPAGGIAAMQAVNVVIQNPVFFIAFFGPALLSLVLAAAALLGWHGGSAVAIYVGAAFYLAGIMAVTIAINVPMNNALMAVDPASAEGARYWATYLSNWTAWNHVRTVAGIAACVSYILALR